MSNTFPQSVQKSDTTPAHSQSHEAMRCTGAIPVDFVFLVVFSLFGRASASARFLPGPSVLLNGQVDICHHDDQTGAFSLLSISLAGWQHDHLKHDDDCCVAIHGSSWAAGGCSSKSCERSHVACNPELGTCGCLEGYTFNPATHTCEGCLECVPASTPGGLACNKCDTTLVINENNGTCACPAGQYSPDAAGTGVVPFCQDCEKGYYCVGGDYTGAPNVPPRTACTNGLTTHGMRRQSIWGCVNPPGTKYVITGSEPATAEAVECPENTYGPGYYKQRACVKCPPGYTTNGKTRQIWISACVVPAGYYLKDPGQVQPCPKGEYKEGVGDAHNCTRCSEDGSVTTADVGSISTADCKILLPSYYATAIESNGAITGTAKCPFNFYCPGGQATAVFDPAAYDALIHNSATTKVSPCPFGSWTQHDGATSDKECMTPPGYMTDTSGSTGTTKCLAGEYRAEWKPFGAAGTCTPCGTSISAELLDQVTYHTVAGVEQIEAVATSADACYIEAGQGMYFSTATNAFYAVDCKDGNNYGMVDKTYGLAAHPCRNCPAGMQTNEAATPSSSYLVAHGFTDPHACVTEAGHGYNGRSAPKCAVGFWNAGNNYAPCTPCKPGLTTSDTESDEEADCMTTRGFGFHDGALVPCPLGTYNDASNPLRTATTPCTACPDHLTTSMQGGDSVDDCDMCVAGWGGIQNCFTQCGGSNPATYGPAGRPKDTECVTCPGMAKGFFFDYLAINHPYKPDVVARPGATTAGDCLAEFSQIVDAAWFLGDTATMTQADVSAASGVDAKFVACVAACKTPTGSITSCQFLTFDYVAGTCHVKQTVAGGVTANWLAYKALLAPGPGTKSLSADDEVKPKGLSSGSYTFYQETVQCPSPDTSCTVNGMKLNKLDSAPTFQGCLDACDKDGECAAVSMIGVPTLWTLTTPLTQCWKIKGDSSPGTFKRSLTKTVVTAMAKGCTGNDPTSPDTTFNCAGTPPGTSCVGKCALGTYGAPSAVCKLDGTWGAVQGICESGADCLLAPDAPLNAASLVCDTPPYKTGTTCKLTCNAGFVPSSPSTTCIKGAWATPALSCLPVCNIPTLELPTGATLGGCAGPPPDSLADSEAPYFVGAKCDVRCPVNKAPTGQLECIDDTANGGKWSFGVQCLAVCENVPLPDTTQSAVASCTFSGNPDNEAPYLLGTTCTATCKGATPITATIECVDGGSGVTMWKYHAPPCTASP